MLGIRAVRVVCVTVNFRTPELTVEAVKAAVVAMESIDGRIVVVDNDSGDGSYEKLREQLGQMGRGDRVEVVESGRNGGFGYGNNVAIRAALASDDPPEYVYLFNSDSLPQPGSIAKLLVYADAHPEAGVVGGRVVGLDGSPHQSAFYFPSWLGELEDGLRLGLFRRVLEPWKPSLERLDRTGKVDWTSGCSMLLRSSMLREIGLFDEGFFLYFEETDLCRRAADAGYETHYLSDAVTRHVGGASTQIYERNRRVPTYWFDSRTRYFEKHHGAAYLGGATLLFAGGFALWRLRRPLQGKKDEDPPEFLADLLRETFLRRHRQ